VLRQGAWQIAIGLALGIGLAYTVSSLFGSAINTTLFGITATDWLTYVEVASLVTAVSLFATFVPAKRATRVRPIIALRAD
jgi:ABC-type antimicrobial peptide transport system permease subunit